MALTLGQAVIELAVNSAQFKSELAKARNDFGSFVGGVKSAAQALGVGLSIAGFTALVRNALDTGSAIKDMADRVGVGIEALQELQYAARLSGLGVEELEVGLKKFQVAITDAARGTSAEAVTLFERLGISATTSAGGLLSVEEGLRQVADAINRVKSPTEQADLATKAFGRSGTKLLPLLKEGSAGFAAMAAEARRLGAVIDAETIKATEAAGDEIEKMAIVLKGDLVRAVAAAIPAITEIAGIVRGLSSSVKDFFAIFKSDAELGIADLEKRIEDVKRRLEGLRATGLVFREGAFVAPPRGAGNQRLIDENEAELRRLQALLADKRRAQTPPPTGADALGFALTDQQRDQIIKGWVEAAEAGIAEYEDELRALATLQDERAADEQKLLDQHTAGVIASIESEIDEYESGMREIAKLQDERAADEKRLLAEHNAGVVASIEAEISAYEEGLHAIAALQDASPFRALEEATRRAKSEAEAFGETGSLVRKRFEALKDAMRELIAQEREGTDAFKALKAEFKDTEVFIALEDAVTAAFASIENAISTSVKGVLLGTQSISDAFRNMGQNIGLSLIEQGVRQLLGTLKDLLIEFLNSEAVRAFIKFLVNLGLSLLGSSAGSASGSASSGGGGWGGAAMAEGGVVTRPTRALIGEAGPEAVIPLPHGLSALGGTTVEVNVYAPPGAEVQQRERRGPDGRQIRDIIIGTVTDGIGGGAFDKVLSTSHGLRRRGVAR